MPRAKRAQISALIRDSEFGVIATNSLDGSAPEAAVVAISATNESDIVFGSFVNSRKNTNIAHDPHVSLVIGWDNTKKVTLQIEGHAFLLSGANRAQAARQHARRNPDSKKYAADPRQQYYRVRPYWLRYSDFSLDPQEVWEWGRRCGIQ